MWQVEYTKRFLKELSGLPDNIQSRGSAIKRIICQRVAHRRKIYRIFP